MWDEGVSLSSLVTFVRYVFTRKGRILPFSGRYYQKFYLRMNYLVDCRQDMITLQTTISLVLHQNGLLVAPWLACLRQQ